MAAPAWLVVASPRSYVLRRSRTSQTMEITQAGTLLLWRLGTRGLRVLHTDFGNLVTLYYISNLPAGILRRTCDCSRSARQNSPLHRIGVRSRKLLLHTNQESRPVCNWISGCRPVRLLGGAAKQRGDVFWSAGWLFHIQCEEHAGVQKPDGNSI